MSAPALRLTTLVPNRPTVDINNKLYGFALPDEFGVRDEAALRNIMKAAQELQLLQAERELSADEANGLSFVLDQGVRMVLPDLEPELLTLPPTQGGLSDLHKMQILSSFTETVTAKAGPVPVTTPASAPTTLTGASYFQSLRPHTQESTGGTG